MQMWGEFRLGRVELRMEGRRIRVGGAAETCDVVAVDNPQELDVDDSVGSSFSFLELELGGGLSAPSSSRDSPVGIPLWSLASKSKISAKFNPTLGEQLKRFTNSA